ncbi:PREDICTED: uncharacterized protein LOC105108244 [Populus euphratica]|uniref:CASP-like protein n=1 Tax=Populus euphratica TaxID=75702 RepID=A0AAJ6SY86_POPEU|nr:PREDICTED: uncharacterized protein LOC105108244 [Populus euphratica]
MGSRAIAISTLVLRIFTLLALVACVVLFITNTFRDTVFDDGSKVTFKDLTTYRFVLSTAVIGAAYTLLQLPFALYYALTEKRLIKLDILPELDLYGDKIIAFLLASGVGAGFAASVEIKSLLKDLFDAFAIAGFQDTEDSKALYDKFLNKGIIATSALAFGFVCTALVSVLSSVNRTKTTKGLSFIAPDSITIGSVMPSFVPSNAPYTAPSSEQYGLPSRPSSSSECPILSLPALDLYIDLSCYSLPQEPTSERSIAPFALRFEIVALHANNTWFLVPFKPFMNVIGCRCFYKIKRWVDGVIDCYKVRLVECGFTQQEVSTTPKPSVMLLNQLLFGLFLPLLYLTISRYVSFMRIMPSLMVPFKSWGGMSSCKPVDTPTSISKIYASLLILLPPFGMTIWVLLI